MVSDTMSRFIRIALSINGAAPKSADYKGLDAQRIEYRGRDQKGLHELLRTREITTLDWLRMIDVQFDSDDELYSYLQKLYDYLFNIADELPEIPRR
jgi:hypothetical protein